MAESIRVNFTRKVFTIVAAQLLVTFCFCFASMANPLISSFQMAHQSLLYVALFGTIGTSLALSFSDSLSRTVPTNYVLLAIFTVCESYSVSFITSLYDPAIVVSAMFLTAMVCVGLTMYAYSTKNEVNYFGGLIINISMAMLSLFVLRFFGSFFGNMEFVTLLISAGSAALAGLYFIYDVKKIMGQGSRKVSLDDYIRGAMFLYIDIIRIFIKILQILQKL